MGWWLLAFGEDARSREPIADSQQRTMAKLKITQVSSTIRRPERQKRTMEALGLRRLHQSVELEDSPQLRGMIDKVQHLVSVEEVQG